MSESIPSNGSRVAEIVATDLCIGCGLCEAVTGGRVAMAMTAAGTLRPHSLEQLTAEEDAKIIAACPGAVAEARSDLDHPPDPVWGAYTTMRYAWAADPSIRYRGATGGVLTALGVHLLRQKRVSAILHVGADPDAPMRSRWVLSDTPESVMANTGSRYGPTAPLAGLGEALDREQPFAVIAKPCDLGALHRYRLVDPKIEELCTVRLALVCGGQSTLFKSQAVLDDLGLSESEVSLFRHRGYGNPGPTRIETADGQKFEKTYLELWEDETGWQLETRCKFCPDALGEAADVASADVWPGGAPTGDDEGFNGIIVRSAVGEELVESAVAAGDLVVGGPITPQEFDNFQPHQVAKKHALAARYQGTADAGVKPITTFGLRIEELGRSLTPEAAARERAGSEKRMKAARQHPRSGHDQN